MHLKKTFCLYALKFGLKSWCTHISRWEKEALLCSGKGRLLPKQIHLPLLKWMILQTLNGFGENKIVEAIQYISFAV